MPISVLSLSVCAIEDDPAGAGGGGGNAVLEVLSSSWAVCAICEGGMGGFDFEGTPAGGVDKHVELTSIWAVEDEELGAFTRGTAMLNGLAALANPGTGWALEPVVPICACGAF